MNDRMQIAAMAMQGMLNNSFADDTPEVVAKGAVAYAGALLKALAESEAEAMEWNASDQTVVYGVRCNGELYNAYQPEGSNAVPGDANDE